MPAWCVEISWEAEKDLANLGGFDRTRIIQKLEWLGKNFDFKIPMTERSFRQDLDFLAQEFQDFGRPEKTVCLDEYENDKKDAGNSDDKQKPVTLLHANHPRSVLPVQSDNPFNLRG